jgi:hypothetical protein
MAPIPQNSFLLFFCCSPYLFPPAYHYIIRHFSTHPLLDIKLNLWHSQPLVLLDPLILESVVLKVLHMVVLSGDKVEAKNSESHGLSSRQSYDRTRMLVFSFSSYSSHTLLFFLLVYCCPPHHTCDAMMIDHWLFENFLTLYSPKAHRRIVESPFTTSP